MPRKRFSSVYWQHRQNSAITRAVRRRVVRRWRDHYFGRVGGGERSTTVEGIVMGARIPQDHEVEKALQVALRVDAICTSFEQELQAGDTPSISDHLRSVPADLRPALIRELLWLELEYRSPAGEDRLYEEYLQQYSEYSSLVQSVFARRKALDKSLSLSAIDRDTSVGSPEFSDAEETMQAPRGPHSVSSGVHQRRFGDYVILDEIARGGMGVVYRAKQLSLDRIVALKMILAGDSADAKEVARFEREAVAAAQLHHPNIVKIHEIDRVDNRPFFSMEFVDGQSLSAVLHDGPMPPRVAAQCTRDVAGAIHYAHCRGIWHRDLKPSNILMDSTGQVQVTDFGLARRIERGSELTNSGEILGTPSYMPPEQAAGRSHQTGATSDVYSLGAVLYALLTGRPPFQAENPLDTLLHVLTSDPVTPRKLNPTIPQDLENICLKCLEKEPARRYATAQSLEQDLDRYLSGHAVQARPISRAARMWRWCRRNPVGASLFGVVLFLAVAGPIVAVSQFRLAARELQQRELSDELYGLAQQSIDTYLHEVTRDELLLQSDFHDLRKRLLEGAVEFYRELDRRASGHPELTSQQIVASLRLAEIIFDTADPATAQQKAVEAKDLALEEQRRRPTDPLVYERLFHCYIVVGNFAFKMGHREYALREYRRAISVLTKLQDWDPDNPEHVVARAKVYSAMGNVLADNYYFADAERYYQMALSSAEAIEDSKRRADYVLKVQNNLGYLYLTTCRYSEAENAFRVAVLADEPSTHDAVDLGAPVLRSNLARALRSLGKATEAEKLIASAQRELERSVARHPSIHSLQSLSAGLSLGTARARVLQRKWADALRICNETRVIGSRLVDREPTVVRYQRQLAHVENLTGQVHLKLHEFLAAEEKLLAAHRLYQRVYDEVQDGGCRSDLARSWKNLGSLQMATGRLDEAAGSCRKALDLFSSGPGQVSRLHPLYADNWAAAHETMAEVCSQQERHAEADEEYAAALAIRKQLMSSYPGGPGFAVAYASLLVSQGVTHHLLGRVAGSIQMFKECDDVLRKVDENWPNHELIQLRLVQTRARLGCAYISARLPRRALPLFDEIIGDSYRSDLGAGLKAFLLASSGDASLRNGEEALTLSRQALADDEPTAWKYAVLALAHAECGEFEAAVDAHARATQLAYHAQKTVLEPWIDSFQHESSIELQADRQYLDCLVLFDMR